MSVPASVVSASPSSAPPQVMQAYYEAAVPQPGQEFEFSADDSLQPVHYYRPPLQLVPGAPEHVHRTQIANAEADAAAGLRSWTIAVLCRCLSLDNILLLLTGTPAAWGCPPSGSYPTTRGDPGFRLQRA